MNQENKVCPICAAENISTAEFCEYCGAKLDDQLTRKQFDNSYTTVNQKSIKRNGNSQIKEDAEKTEELLTNETKNNSESNSIIDTDSRQKKQSNLPKILLLILVGVLFLGGIGYFVMAYVNSSNSSEIESTGTLPSEETTIDSSDKTESDSVLEENITSSQEPIPTLTAINTEQWPFFDYFMRENFSAAATSVSAPKGETTYSAFNLIDNAHETVWAEGVSGNGIGETITITYVSNSPFNLSKIYFLNGNSNTMEEFDIYNVPKQFELYYNDKAIAYIDLNKTPDPQMIQLNENLVLNQGDEISFVLTEVYPGTDRSSDTTMLGEIRLD